MPDPARSMGVSPTLGFTTEPVKVLIGDCYEYDPLAAARIPG